MCQNSSSGKRVSTDCKYIVHCARFMLYFIVVPDLSQKFMIIMIIILIMINIIIIIIIIIIMIIIINVFNQGSLASTKVLLSTKALGKKTK